MKKVFPRPFSKKVLDILDDELTPRMASVTGGDTEEVMALGAAYVHGACILMREIDMDQELFKMMLLDTVDYVWKMAEEVTTESIH